MASDVYVKNLTTQRNRAWEQQKAVLDRAVNAKRDLDPLERGQVERLDDELDRLDDEIHDWVDRDRVAREGDQARVGYEHVVRPSVVNRNEARQADDIRQVLTGQRGSIEFDVTGILNEKRAIRGGASGAEFRDLTVGTAGAGGNTVPTSFVRQLIDYLEVETPMFQLARILNTAGGENLELPRVSSHGTAAIVGEGTALAEADAAFTKLTLGSWKYGQLLQISRELVEDSGVDITGFIAEDMGRALGRAIGAAFTKGTGTNAPLGYAVALGTAVTSLGTNAATVDYDRLVDMAHGVNSRYRRNGQWTMSDSFEKAVRKLKDGENNPIWQPSVVAGRPDTLLGYPVNEDPHLDAIGTSATPAAFGDWNQAYIIRTVGPVKLEASKDYAFANDLVTYRATWRVDGDVYDISGVPAKVYRGGTA